MNGQVKSDNMVFLRQEKKYLLTAEKYTALMERIASRLEADEYGSYTICSLYYDNDNFDLARRSVDKPEFKEKLRLRSYGTPDYRDKVFLEIKRKYKGIVAKRRVTMTLADAENFLERGIYPAKKCQILKEIEYFVKFYKVSPKAYVSYDRTAFCGKDDKRLRITFDDNIKGRTTALGLAFGSFGGQLLKEGEKLMEIKVPTALPKWLCDALNELQIYPTSFSKYGTVYKNKLNSQGEQLCFQASLKQTECQLQAR